MRKIIVTTKVTQASVSISKRGYHPLTPNMSALALTLTIYIISFFENPQSPLPLKGVHLSLWSLPSGKGQNDGLRKPTNHRGFWYRGTTRWFSLCLAAWGAGRSDEVFDGLAAWKVGGGRIMNEVVIKSNIQ